ncbi:MAG TPA: DUF4097 family beta strand repeat-containing protein [Vicinamibacterales bacterium]|nr:DUF4097 family beta strand repeat-containing protein [Vicinamibacterales bacterium]
MPPKYPQAALFLTLALAGCDVSIHEGKASIGGVGAEARQEWARTYEMASGGHLEIANLNGPIELTAAAGRTLDIRAEIVAKSLTESAANQLLSKGKIEETVSPSSVKVETVVPRGVHGSYEVRYKASVPAGVNVEVSTTNGSLTATALGTSALKAAIVNGTVRLMDMSGPIDAVSVNGSLSAELASVTAPVRLEITNGQLTLQVPKSSKANLVVRVVNGRLNVSGLTDVGEPRGNRIRNLEAALNGGGPVIDLRATNGRLSIEGK